LLFAGSGLYRVTFPVFTENKNVFTPAEIPKWQALGLFDKYLAEQPQTFRTILEDHGWAQANVPGSARIFMKSGSPMVFKLCDESILWQGYDAFARRLRQPDIIPDEYPNLPRVYRYRKYIALLEKQQGVSSRQSEIWYGEIMNMYRYPDETRTPPEMQPTLTKYRQVHPHLGKALNLIRNLAVGNSFKVKFKAIDILQRPGTSIPVILDPLH
jgi:hypothetical protein